MMLIQLFLGGGLLIFSILVAGVSFWVLDGRVTRRHDWLGQAPHGPKLLLVLLATAVWVIVQMTISVWAWAIVFLALGLFTSLEPAVYFSLVAFTTLGFGDILLPDQWRLLGGMAAMNGLLNIGLVTAAMIETIRQVRVQQRSSDVTREPT